MRKFLNKVKEKIKSYHPNKYIWYLYLFIPIFISSILRVDKESDIFFLLKYGERVLNSGFPKIDWLSMHQNFSFVMQQWLSATIFYNFYHIFGHYGLIFIVCLINILIIYMMYKFCMLLSNNNYKVSIILTIISDLLLESSFILPRPQIFDYLNLIIVLYIMEDFYKNGNSKKLLILIAVSLLQINLHSSTWFVLFLFMLPYVVSLIYEKIKDHSDKRIYKVILVMFIMFLVGFINPYGIKNILYVITSYGNYYIDNLVIEMLPPVLLGTEYSIYGVLTFFTMTCVIAVYIIYKKSNISLRYGLLLLGVTILAITHIRNYSLYIIGAILPLALYLKNILRNNMKDKFIIDKEYRRHYTLVICILFVYIILLVPITNNKFTNTLEKGIDYLLKYNKKENIILYAGYNNGSYCEFRGLKPYIDSRAEIFLKSNNKKKDILKEYYLLSNNRLDYNKFIDEYKFTHLIVSKGENIYGYIKNDKKYKVIFKGKGYMIFERKDLKTKR